MRARRALGLLGAVLVLGVAGCGLLGGGASTVPVALLSQVAPDGKSLTALVPSSLIQQQGGLDRVIQRLRRSKQFEILRFGEKAWQFAPVDLQGEAEFAPVAVFALPQALSAPKPLDAPPDWQQAGLIVPAGEVQATVRSYELTCPPQIAKVALAQAREAFAKLNLPAANLARLSIVSITCLDLEQDGQPELVYGVRLDNPLRPLDVRDNWQAFLARPENEREEYSLLLLSHEVSPGLAGSTQDAQWQTQTLIEDIRPLDEVGDSVDSYLLAGAADLDGDGTTELVVQQQGLRSFDVQVLTAKPNEIGDLIWRDYYQPKRALR